MTNKGINMSFDNPYVTAEFVTLTPDQVRYYEEVKRIISGIVDQPDGVMYVLNALALTGDTTLAKMRLWVDEAASGSMDSRALVGIIHERPLGEPMLNC